MSADDETKALTSEDISRLRTNEIEGWVGGIGALSFLAGATTFCYQLYLWLKLGEWVPLPISTVFTWVGIDYSLLTSDQWLGLQKIIVWVLDLPMFLMLPLFGIAIGYIVGYLVVAISDLRSKYVS